MFHSLCAKAIGQEIQTRDLWQMLNLLYSLDSEWNSLLLSDAIINLYIYN